MLYYLRNLTGAGLLLGLVACDGGTGAVLTIDATGTVSGTVFLDVNGDGEMTPPADRPAAGLQVTLLQRGTSRTVARATTNEAGVYSLPSIPVGRYNLTIDSQSLGDSLKVVRVNPSEVQVGADSIASVAVAVDRRVLSIAAARGIEAGRHVSVEGFALSAWNNFGDATLHIADETGFLRAVRVPSSSVVVGRRVRMTGAILLQDGRPVLDQPVVIALDSIAVPQPRALSSARAATAEGGALDGGLARVQGARIVEVSQVQGGNRLVTIDDGSGRLGVSLQSAAGVVTEFPLAAGMTMDVTGVLVPQASAWRLRPRSSVDVVVTLPTPTIAQFRTLPAGTMVSLEGVATTSTADFADGTVHLTDGTGSLRATGITGVDIDAGDRVRLVGTVGASNAQPILVGSAREPLILGSVALQAPASVNAATAANARDGELDAALVRVGLMIVTDVATVGTDRRVTVQDLSGSLEIILDGDSDIPANLLVPNRIILGVTGVLIPTTGGRWHLKPRSASDISR